MTIFSTLSLFGALLASAQAAPVPQGEGCAPGTRYPVHVRASGLKDGSGLVLVELFAANDQSFLNDDSRSQQHASALVRQWVKPKGDGTAEACIAAPSTGDFALMASHDRDGTPKFSVSKDGLAMPGNAKLGRHRPTLAETRIRVGQGGTDVPVTMQYLRGLAGFGPNK